MKALESRRLRSSSCCCSSRSR